MKSMLVCKSFHLEFPKAILWVVGSRTFKPLCRQNKLLLAIIHLHSQILFFVTNFLFNIFTITHPMICIWILFRQKSTKQHPRKFRLRPQQSLHFESFLFWQEWLALGKDNDKRKKKDKDKNNYKKLKQRQSQRQMKITLRPFWSLPSGMTCTRLALKWPFRANFK